MNQITARVPDGLVKALDAVAMGTKAKPRRYRSPGVGAISGGF